VRSYLFAPGTDARLVPKALASDADIVVIDLEDAVLSGARSAGHRVLAEHRAEIAARPTHLRIGWAGNAYALEDVEWALEVGVTALRLPKAETAAMIEPVLGTLGEDPTIRLHPTIESALGLANVSEMAAASAAVERFVFGERDFLADVGVDQPGPLTDHARAQLALTSRAVGVLQPIDGAFIHLDDPAGLHRSAERARQFGFWGKSAIHPAQLPVIHEVFSHSPKLIDWAKRVTAAHEEALEAGKAVSVVDGTFIDAAVVRRAADILEGHNR
jgi:citrate lyase subunit beta/citryl-CoA lyase